MARWLIFSIIVGVLTGILTIIWWWVGDLWADEEHQRFKPGETDQNAGATVIRDFDRTEDENGGPGVPHGFDKPE